MLILTKPIYLISAVLLFSFYPCITISAQGNLLIAPKRIVFEGSLRYSELNLANIGKDSARYEISLIHYKMKEDGSLEEVSKADSALMIADPFIRFFPRAVVLAPNESQVLKVQLTQTHKLKTGEYRSHLYFRSVSNDTVSGSQGNQKNESSPSISVNLKPVFGISIPVIVRSGEPAIKLGLSNCSFEKEPFPLVKITINRTGNISSYGNISIDHISPTGEVTRVAQINGIAVYTSTTSRTVKVAINKTPAIDLSKGKLHIVYMPQVNANQNNIAQTEVFLK